MANKLVVRTLAPEVRKQEQYLDDVSRMVVPFSGRLYGGTVLWY